MYMGLLAIGTLDFIYFFYFERYDWFAERFLGGLGGEVGLRCVL
jgi:hypothetical protein